VGLQFAGGIFGGSVHHTLQSLSLRASTPIEAIDAICELRVGLL